MKVSSETPWAPESWYVSHPSPFFFLNLLSLLTSPACHLFPQQTFVKHLVCLSFLVTGNVQVSRTESLPTRSGGEEQAVNKSQIKYTSAQGLGGKTKQNVGDTSYNFHFPFVLTNECSSFQLTPALTPRPRVQTPSTAQLDVAMGASSGQRGENEGISF